MAHAFISIGSNIDPTVNVRAAVQALAESVRIARISTVYLSEAEGSLPQPRFYNCVVEVRTELQPAYLKFKVLRRIEAELGRCRTGDRYAPRTIDLDLILYDDVVLNTDGIVLPDPEIARRPFLAVPLSELDPDRVIPGTVASVSEIAGGLAQSALQPLDSYTASLRELIRALATTGKSSELSDR
jgi:2-amino-4-hydroxy-6-hydroxymethyldihydropteridine diphosphokinase